jgi:hypothetical protein
MFWLVRRNDAPPVWCAWETLARRVVEREASGGAGEFEVRSEVKIYATEDLVAYHLWYALSSDNSAVGRRFRVATIANLPGLVEDKGFFIPRGFDEVQKTDAAADGALGEERFWAAFRDTDWNEAHPLLRVLAERGYEIEERFAVTASGQQAFIISARRRER